MKKITLPGKAERTEAPRPEPAADTPRPRLGLRYGAGTDSRARP